MTMNHDARAGYGPVGSPCEMDEKSEDDQGTTPGPDRPPVRVKEGSWMYLTMNLPVTTGGQIHQRTMNKKSKKLECPNCGSQKIFAEAAFITGFKYHCEDCDYIGPLVIEKDVEDEG